MAYSEQDGQVIFSMSREDYETLLMIFGIASGLLNSRGDSLRRLLAAIGEMNWRQPSPSPHSTPTEEK